MSYVPIVVPVTPNPPSPRTRELAGLLGQVLEEYQKAHPSVTATEMREAIQIVKGATGGSNAPVAVALSLGLGLLALAAGLGLFFLRSGGEIELGSSMPMVLFAVIAFLGIVVVAVKIASR